MSYEGPQTLIIQILPKLSAYKTRTGGKGLKGNRQLSLKMRGISQGGGKSGDCEHGLSVSGGLWK
jgi:hypothetical protein